MLLLRDVPKYECIQACAEKFGGVDPSAVHSCLLLLRVASDVLSQLEQCFADAGLSQGRFTVLMLLHKSEAAGEGVASPSDLAERACVTRATMTGLLDGLEREGFVQREPDPQDRRMLAVRITGAGRARLESMLPGYFRLVARLMGPLSESQRAALVELLSAIRPAKTAETCGTGSAEAAAAGRTPEGSSAR